MKKRIGIFRALDVRFPHADFATSFKRFKPHFIANISTDMREFLVEKEARFTNIDLKPAIGFDPMYPLLQKKDFTPWLQFGQPELDKVSSSLDMFEIYEPYFFYSSQIATLASKKNVPLITEIWTSFSQHPSRYIPPYNWLVNHVIQRTDLFVLRTQRALRFLGPYCVPENKKVIIYHGVDITRFLPAKKNHERIKILIVGTLAAHKGLDDLLAVFPRLVEKHPEKVELIICGDGPLRDVVEQLSKKFPINYLGYVSNQKLPEIYNSCDIYCQPSKDYYFFGIKGGEEFAGYTFMEAMAAGLPIISTYCGGIPEIVGEDNLLITQSNREQLFQALDTYITNPSLCHEIGQKNRERAVEFFSIAKQTAKLESLVLQKFV